MVLQERAYGPDSTPVETQAIERRVSVVADRLLLLHEIPVQSPFSIDVMFDRIEALARDWPRFAYVADLTAAKRPDPETRARLKHRVTRIQPRLIHVAIVVGSNLIMQAMARLFAHSMGLVSVSIHATRDGAIERATRDLGR
jgi:hypothetical protein